MQQALARETRDRIRQLRVVVSASERARIEERAKATGLSVSAYLRSAGLGQVIRSTLDHEAILELAKVNGDQGRLGGLLKLWLVDRPPALEHRRSRSGVCWTASASCKGDWLRSPAACDRQAHLPGQGRNRAPLLNRSAARVTSGEDADSSHEP